MNPVKAIRRRISVEKRLRRDFERFGRLAEASGENLASEMNWSERRPIFEDTVDTAFDAHYIYHPAWAARILAENQPALHTDISSTLYFCSIVSAFIPVAFYDYRPARLKLSRLTSGQADLAGLPFQDNSISSLSCMHVVEHIGLGRYGDRIDPGGDQKAMSELTRVLAPGGSLLFAAPIGKPKIIFNAHRIYSYRQIIKIFTEREPGGLKLQKFSLIPDNALETGMIEKATEAQADQQSYACGCFWFKKP
jgi:SAM-dependent methyltransferase